MRITARCEIGFDAGAPTPMILMLRPQSGYGQWIASESYTLTPQLWPVEYVDSYGNLCQRVVVPSGPFSICAECTVETPDTIDTAPGAPLVPAEQLPDMALQFLLPSRYCESDELGDLAQEIAGSAAPGYDQVEAIRVWIHDNVEYRYGTSNSQTSAADTAEQRVGVCRDYTHLGIALCRALNIPARMVVGYLYQLDPMDLHAWFEAYVGGRWYTFDATQDGPRGGRIVLAYGRDAADVALTTQFGPATLTDMHVSVDLAQ